MHIHNIAAHLHTSFQPLLVVSADSCASHGIIITPWVLCAFQFVISELQRGYAIIDASHSHALPTQHNLLLV